VPELLATGLCGSSVVRAESLGKRRHCVRVPAEQLAPSDHAEDRLKGTGEAQSNAVMQNCTATGKIADRQPAFGGFLTSRLITHVFLYVAALRCTANATVGRETFAVHSTQRINVTWNVLSETVTIF